MDQKNAPAPGAVPAPAPESRLEVLRRREMELQKLQEQATAKDAEARRDSDAAKVQAKDFTELKRSFGEVDQAAAAYRTAYPKLDQRRTETDGYRTAKRPRIEAAVGADKKALDDARTWLDQETDTRRQTLADREAKLATALAEKQKADRALESCRLKYDAAKGRQKAVETTLTGLEGLRKQVDRAEDDVDGATTDADRKQAARRAYLTLGEFDDRFADLGTQLVDDQTNAAELDKAWLEWGAAQEKVQETQLALLSAQEAVDLAKAHLAELSDRIAAVLAHLDKPAAAAN